MVIGRAERRRRGLPEIDLPIAAQFPDHVAGMVLLDSAAPKLGLVPPTNTEPYNFVGRVSALLPAVAHLGAGRLVAQISMAVFRHARGTRRAPIRRPPGTSRASSRSFSTGRRLCSRRRC